MLNQGQEYLFAFQQYEQKTPALQTPNAPFLIFADSTTEIIDFVVQGQPALSSMGQFPKIGTANLPIPSIFSMMLDNPWLFYLDSTFTWQLKKPNYWVSIAIPYEPGILVNFLETPTATAPTSTIVELIRLGSQLVTVTATPNGYGL